ncbi:hypothetical protein A2933_01110 [Candidatus Nomurabacteria bacterium RIFCSPLOWO2_01_FULL_46_18]|uniref:Uncharacterized protein n=1 Tax=Candidatus Nomurabacteria bacterium RIFCSPLOWO2_01_FULL_46_18 TaxID=1801783 RepID=A0A1F6XEP3_9BACT|nr:MAG: hypothetical protein A2933_01110 [Candidatus Nomurabacteria bacterium RIFCSPLOWO2_01_FULL_46_18]
MIRRSSRKFGRRRYLRLDLLAAAAAEAEVAAVEEVECQLEPSLIQTAKAPRYLNKPLKK